MIIINDLHIGTSRVAGTTVSSRATLKQTLHDGLKELLRLARNQDICVLGDLFDGYRVDMADWVQTFQTFNDHLSHSDAGMLYLVAGNHDLSKNSSNMSSFEALGELLHQVHDELVRVITRPTYLDFERGTYAIPHMVNQEEFDAALKAVPKCRHLLVHCNYDNKFAQQSDHSLNMSKEQAEAVPAERIIFAHEHQQKSALGGKVQIIGNQLVSSIADCLGNDTKRYLNLTDDLQWVEFTKIEDLYCEKDWRVLQDVKDQGFDMFIRVTGKASEEEAAEVAKAVSQFRDKSSALVISNAVKVGSSALTEETLENALRDVQGFNVMSALRSLVTDTEMLKMFDASVSRVTIDQKEY